MFLKCIFSKSGGLAPEESLLELLKQDNFDQLSWPYLHRAETDDDPLITTLKFLLGHSARVLHLIATIFLNLINGNEK